MRLAQYYWQPCISQFRDITEGALWISTGSLVRQVPKEVATFQDLVIGYSLLPVGNCVS